MRLEHIPLILGVIVALIGLGFIADASMAAAAPVTPERRRRARAEPSRAGEAVVGIGTLCMAAALFGRDTWRYGTVAVLVGSGLLLVGVILNRAFLKEALLFRGPARRSEEGVAAKPRAPRGGGKDRPAATAPTPPAVRPATSTKSAGTEKPPVRHPTPPVGSRTYSPPEPAGTSPPPVAGQAGFDGGASPPAPAKPAGARPSDAAPPAKPAPMRPPAAAAPRTPEPPATPPERRKTPRGKR